MFARRNILAMYEKGIKQNQNNPMETTTNISWWPYFFLPFKI